MIRSTDHHHAIDTLEARLGARLASTLNERAAMVPHDISERLRVSRERALVVARQAAAARQPVVAGGVVGVTRHGAAQLGRGQGIWIHLASWMPLAVLVAGLVLIQEWTDREQVLAAAEIDAVLLADDLPPAAWTDPGFREYLKAPPP
jgi:Protein of unknown function (DUF3619)